MVNKEFIKKIIKAKKYEYEAIKEILPDNFRNEVEEFEKEAFSLLNDAAIEVMKEDSEDITHKKTIKKVDVDFS
jgi:hypothetical protein